MVKRFGDGVKGQYCGLLLQKIGIFKVVYLATVGGVYYGVT